MESSGFPDLNPGSFEFMAASVVTLQQIPLGGNSSPSDDFRIISLVNSREIFLNVFFANIFLSDDSF